MEIDALPDDPDALRQLVLAQQVLLSEKDRALHQKDQALRLKESHISDFSGRSVGEAPPDASSALRAP